MMKNPGRNTLESVFYDQRNYLLMILIKRGSTGVDFRGAATQMSSICDRESILIPVRLDAVNITFPGRTV